MGLFSLGKKHGRSVALIDIGSASVGGAYVQYRDGEQPVIYYTARVAVEPREGESITDSMMRSLSFLDRLMVEEGAPTLRREVGSGHVEEVLVSVSAPWQETVITTTRIEERHPFTFTHHHLDLAGRGAPIGTDKVRSGRTVIASILNGYETSNPFGKRASRADLIVLTSTIDRTALKLIQAGLRKTFHTSAITVTAFAPVSYAVFRDLYPHQKDFVVLDVSGTGSDVAFVKRGLLADTHAIPYGLHDLSQALRKAGQRAHLGADDIIDPSANLSFAKEAEAIREVWLESLREAFASFSKNQALPRTVFLLADQDSRDYLKRLLEESKLRTLWLSDEPLTVLALSPANLAPFVKTRGLGEGDLYLAILALFASRRDHRDIPESQ
jgi:hypothetical protein